MAGTYVPKLGPSVGAALPGLPRRGNGNGDVTTNWKDIPYPELNGSKSVASEATLGIELSVSKQGTRFYLFDGTTAYQYDLGIPYDITTAVYSGNSVLLTGVDSALEGFDISSNGEHLFVVGGTATDSFYRFDMSTPWELDTASVAGGQSLAVGITAPKNCTISTDGDHIYTVDGNSAILREFTLSTPYDLTSGSFTQTKDFGADFGTTRSHRFSEDGLFLAIADTSANSVWAVALTVPWDISTAVILTRAIKLDFTGVDAMTVSRLTDVVYVHDDATNQIRQYKIG